METITKIAAQDRAAIFFRPYLPSRMVVHVLCDLSTKAEYVDTVMEADVPYSKEISDYGDAISSLIRKGLVALENGRLYLTEYGNNACKPFAGGEFAETLLTWQTEANCIYTDATTGRAVIEGFSNSVIRMVELISPSTAL